MRAVRAVWRLLRALLHVGHGLHLEHARRHQVGRLGRHGGAGDRVVGEPRMGVEGDPPGEEVPAVGEFGRGVSDLP